MLEKMQRGKRRNLATALAADPVNFTGQNSGNLRRLRCSSVINAHLKLSPSPHSGAAAYPIPRAPADESVRCDGSVAAAEAGSRSAFADRTPSKNSMGRPPGLEGVIGMVGSTAPSLQMLHRGCSFRIRPL